MNAGSAFLLAALVNFSAADLGQLPPENVKVLKPDRVVWVKDGKAELPIVCGGALKSRSQTLRLPVSQAAQWLQSAVKEMTGVEPEVVFLLKDEKPPAGPALFIGDDFAKAAGIACPDGAKEEFRVVSKDGALYFCGKADFAVYDFAERALGVRQYWKSDEDGRSVVKTPALALPEIDYGDAPCYPKREIWPKEWWDSHRSWKCGSHHPIAHKSHVPHNWWNDTNYNYRVTRPEIFELTRAGQRCMSPMLCYSNPKTFETYVERLEAELAGGPDSGVYDARTKVLSITQWDGLVDCQCEDCKKLYDEKAGPSGNASPIVFGFVRKMSDYLAEKHPDITIGISAYLNTCMPNPGLSFPAGNVEANVCAMPGMAMLKDPRVWEAEEGLMRRWRAVTRRPVRTVQYSCWPAEYCNAPFVFGKVAQDHYRRMKGDIVGTFVCGPYPTERLSLSVYVWMRALWNPEFDVDAVYDTFAERMFGAGAKPMRKLIAMQEAGWMRPWNVPQISNKNIYEISYPRNEVIVMEKLIAEAKKLAAGDESTLKRIKWYENGFLDFFKESEDLASGTALEPSRIQKVAANPVVDGRLDDEAWKAATAYPFVREMDRQRADPYYPTDVRLVWTPNGGVTVGYRCTEPFAGDETIRKKIREMGSVEILDTFLDVSGAGDGHYCQIYLEDDARPVYYTDGPNWSGKGVEAAVWFGRDEWFAEIYIPFAAITDLPQAQFPEGTSSGGKFWLGNFCRSRVWDSRLPKAERREGSKRESSRRYTRYSIWNKDPAAFGKLMFVE